MTPNVFFHLWAGPPQTVFIPCPEAIPGDPASGPGLLDPATINASYGALAASSIVAVLVMVAVCYLATRTTLGTRFVWRWWGFLIATAILCAGLAPLVLRILAGTRALAGSCVTNPTAFAYPLPWQPYVLQRSLAGLVWGIAAFLLVSLVATGVVGRMPQAGGFFHNRGCPVPRWRP